MANETPDIELRNNREQRRYEAHVGDAIAFAEYMLHGQTLTLTHTDVPESLEGQGVGSKLARFALDDARDNGYTVLPLCPFIAGYIRRHPEYQPLVIGYTQRNQGQ